MKQNSVRPVRTQSLEPSTTIKVLLRGVLLLVFLPLLGIIAVLFTAAREIVYQNAHVYEIPAPHIATETFPVGVDPKKKTITENPDVEGYFDTHLASVSKKTHAYQGFFGHIIATLTEKTWYQNLASPSGRMLVIRPGERKEEIAERFARLLAWDSTEKSVFLASIAGSEQFIADAKFFPWTYVVGKDATPDDVVPLVLDRYTSLVEDRYNEDVANVVPLQDAVIIASLLEREAYDFEDMRYISGVIWNRLFVGMNLQIDATLQYAKGKQGKTWWSRVVPDDKYIASPYNTYKNPGLPPGTISNVSLDSILAALNPRKTDCMYYFHDPKGKFYCSVTYEEHVAGLKKVYGRGK